MPEPLRFDQKLPNGQPLRFDMGPAFRFDAIFRASAPPEKLVADGLVAIDYLTPTGWAKPTTPTIGWDYFGWNGTNSMLSVTVETTNQPARVVMMTVVRRRGLGDIMDQIGRRWEKIRGGTTSLRGHAIYSTNLTIADSARH